MSLIFLNLVHLVAICFLSMTDSVLDVRYMDVSLQKRIQYTYCQKSQKLLCLELSNIDKPNMVNLSNTVISLGNFFVIRY